MHENSTRDRAQVHLWCGGAPVHPNEFMRHPPFSSYLAISPHISPWIAIHSLCAFWPRAAPSRASMQKPKKSAVRA